MAEHTKATIDRFIQFYVTNRDVSKAAKMAHISVTDGNKLMREPAVKKSIEKRIDLIEMEMAKLEAKATMLTVNVLDGALMEEIQNKKSGVRLRAIELGFRRTGMIRDGEFFVPQPPSGENSGPNIYRALQTTTLRRTVTEELVHQAEAAIAAEPAPLALSPLTIEGEKSVVTSEDSRFKVIEY